MTSEPLEEIDITAGEWFAHRESSDWTREEAARLEAWLSESPLHRIAYLRIEHAWERAARLRAFKIGSARVPPAGDSVRSPFFGVVRSAAQLRRRARRPRKVVWAVGAGLAAALVASLLVGVFWPHASTYRTPVGGLESVPIADGSKVTLNTDTTLRIAMTQQERRVTLDRGEAFFEVAKDRRRPFVVQVGKRRVIAVGTQFSVRRDRDDIQVVVTEGTVELRTADSMLSDSGQDTPALLPAGTVAHAGDSGVLIRKEPEAIAEEQLSWRQGILVFHDATLAEAVAEFNRYNLRHVVIEDPTVAAYKVAGEFRASNLEGFVRLLERGYPIHAQQRDDRVLLTAR